MAILQKAPPPNSPANNEQLYAKLVDAIHGAAQYPVTAPREVAVGLTAFRDVARAFFDVRRFQGAATWRGPFEAALRTFLSLPNGVTAQEAGRLIPDEPYAKSGYQETACLFITKAAFRVAAGEPVKALTEARFAALCMDMAWRFFDNHYTSMSDMWEQMKPPSDDSARGWNFGVFMGHAYSNLIAAPALTVAQRPYVRSNVLLLGCSHSIESLVTKWAEGR
jgi:hypothetical protein